MIPRWIEQLRGKLRGCGNHATHNIPFRACLQAAGRHFLIRWSQVRVLPGVLSESRIRSAFQPTGPPGPSEYVPCTLPRKRGSFRGKVWPASVAILPETQSQSRPPCHVHPCLYQRLKNRRKARWEKTGS